MITLHVLAPEAPNDRWLARSRRHPPRIALWLLGVFASAAACNGTIDDNEGAGGTRPPPSAATNPQSNGARSPISSGGGVATGTAGAAEEREPSGISARANDGLGNVSGSSRSSGSRRGGADGRGREIEEDIDAGAVEIADAGDAGPIDADAGALEVDGGPTADAGIALP